MQVNELTKITDDAKNIFIITSYMMPQEGIIYGKPRSVYTHDQRYEQTLGTINSIRETVPQTYIILVELSDLLPKYKKILFDIVDCFIDLSHDKSAQHYAINDKSIGDLYSVLQGYLFVLTSNIKFDVIYKISGRYYLDNNFKLSNFDKNHITFNRYTFMTEDKKTVYYTTGYGCGYEMKLHLLKGFLDAFFILQQKECHNIEGALFKAMDSKTPNLRFVDKIGVSGLVSTTGELAVT